jgi:hypothetical protein
MIEFCTARIGSQLFEGAGHASQAELTQLLECGMGQQLCSPQW